MFFVHMQSAISIVQYAVLYSAGQNTVSVNSVAVSCIQCAVYSVQCDVYTLQFVVYSVLCTVCS